MRLPDFIIIGAAKSGTTTLYQHLLKQPAIFMSTPKEPNFFSHDERYARGLEAYGALFEPAGSHQLCGEASTNYTNWPLYPDTVARMAAACPSAKLIYIMRHPVSRAYSHYAQLIKNERFHDADKKVDRAFEEHVARDDSVIRSSEYMVQIERYLERFPRQSMLGLILDDLQNEPAKVVAKIFDFLGLRVDETTDYLVSAENQADGYNEWQVRMRTLAPLKAIPGVERLGAMLPKRFRDFVYATLRSTPYSRRIREEFVPPPMRVATRERLLAHFRPHNKRLAEFLGRDLSAWDH